MSQPQLSAVIITYNEEKNIARCLDSLQGVADEIIVIDSFSTDQTESLCASYGVQFIKHPFAGHIEQKNIALDHAKGEYILSLDADEALSPELREQILKLKKQGLENALGYCFNRLTRYTDHWVRHSGWYPDTKLRLIKKGAARWQGTNPHDILTLHQGKPTWLPGDLLHYSYSSISDHVRQTNKFTTIAAKASFAKGQRSSLFKILTRPPLKFLRDYFWKLGFLDGRIGFIICWINALSALLKYAKLYDLQRKIPIDES